MLTVCTAAAVVLSTVVAAPADPVTITVLSTVGDGCPAASTTVAMSLDNQAFTVTYGDFLVTANGQEAKKDCKISLRINHPDNVTYGIAATDYRGFANLLPKSRGVERASYHFPGMPTRHSTRTYDGPMSDNWQVTDEPNPGDVVHGPCKERKPLTIDAELKLTGKKSELNFMSMDSTDSSVTAAFRLSWRKC